MDAAALRVRHRDGPLRVEARDRRCALLVHHTRAEPPAAVSAGLEPEGITFIGSTFADLRPGVVLLDPQGEVLEVDRVVTLSDVEATSYQDARSRTTASGALSVRSPR